jgi:AcrR family transcriptional regulator
MDDVARRAQFSKATLYRYFRDKGELIFAIIINYFDEVSGEMARIRSQKLTATEKLMRLIQAVLKFHQEKMSISHVFIMDKSYVKLLRLFISHGPQRKLPPGPETKFLAMIRAKRKEVLDQGIAVIKEGIASGEFRKVDGWECVVFIESLLEGFLHARFWYENPPSPGREMNIIKNFLLHGIVKKKK